MSNKVNLFTQRILCISFVLLVSCKKFVEVSPPKTVLGTSTVYANEASARAAVNGLFSKLIESGFASGDVNSVTYLSSLSSDELLLVDNAPEVQAFYVNGLIASNSLLDTHIWSAAYQIIYASNSIVLGVQSSLSLPETVKAQLLAEAKFVRAFCNFYLVSLFGGVPLTTSTDYVVNNALPRAPVAAVYDSIISDLTFASQNLPADYSLTGDERIRPIKWAAEALMARTCLYTGNYEKALECAEAVLNRTDIYHLENSLDSVFLKNSMEAIWQLKPVQPNNNTNEALAFIAIDNPTNAVLNPSWLSGFEEGDQRRVKWIDSLISDGNVYHFPYKYKIRFSQDVSEYSMVIRLAEMYLIRAEAELHLSNILAAHDDVNVIRLRAGLPEMIETDAGQLTKEIIKQRSAEYFAEWGHRWMDLRRLNIQDSIMNVAKPGNWQTADALYPIPKSQMENDKNIIQNPGY